MRLWIVGKYGLVARTLTDHLDKLSYPYISTSSQEVDITYYDQIERFLEAQECTHIVNCAAMAQVDLAEAKCDKAFLLNAEAPKNLARAAKKWQKKLIHLSTDYLFSGNKRSPYTEEDPMDPINIYGKSKQKGEELIKKEGPSFLIIRPSRIFSPFKENFISRMCALMQTKKELTVIDGEISKPTCAKDLSRAITDLLNYEGIVHFANGEGASRFELVRYIFGWLKNEGVELACKEIIPCKEFPMPAKRAPYSVLDCSKAEKWLGYAIPSWQDRISSYLKAVTYDTSSI